MDDDIKVELDPSPKGVSRTQNYSSASDEAPNGIEVEEPERTQIQPSVAMSAQFESTG